MLTEDDLRAALLDFADRNEPDAAAMRAEIDAQLTGPARIDHQSVRRPLSTLISVAACVAVVIAVAVGIHASRSRSTTPPIAPLSSGPGPTVLGMAQYPGTIVLASFSGHGSRTISFGQHLVPKNSLLSVIVKCSGSGIFNVATAIYIPRCDTAETRGGSLDSRSRSIQIITSTSVNWQAVIVIGPDAQTNGTVVGPAGGIFDGVQPNLGAASGRGGGNVHLAPAAATGNYLIYVECSGLGVTITSSSKAVEHDYTRTCFNGFAYQWQVAKRDAPTTLKISASKNTSWTVRVLPV